MNNSTEGGSVLARLASELLNDERVLPPSERGLLSKVLDDSRAESTGNPELDAAVARRLVSAAVGSMGERIVGALADEVVRQLLGRQDPTRERMTPPAPGGGGGSPMPPAPADAMMMQVSPYNPGNYSPYNPTGGGQVSPVNPGNYSPYNPTGAGQVSPVNPGNTSPYV